jgi:hypothetical protein
MKDKKMMRGMKAKVKRILLDGSEVEEFDNAIDITIHTKCPGKWKLIDMETGQEYIGTHESPTLDILNSLKNNTIVPKAFIKYGHWVKVKGRKSISKDL